MVVLDRHDIKKALRFNLKRDLPPKTIARILETVGAEADGGFDYDDIHLIASWQQDHGMGVDGMMGPMSVSTMAETWDVSPTGHGNDSNAFSKAAANNRKGPFDGVIWCQSTNQMIDLATEDGISWVRRHQEALGLEPDGILGAKSRKAIVKRYGAFSKKLETTKPMPVFVYRWRYDHAHIPWVLDWPYIAPDWTERTAALEWDNGALRLVSGWRPGNPDRTSRPPWSWISLDLISIFIAHYWAKTLPKFLRPLVAKFIELADGYWSSEMLQTIVEPRGLEKFIKPVRGPRTHQAKFNELCAGWVHFMRSCPQAIELGCEMWLKNYVGQGRDIAHWAGWKRELRGSKGGIILAACTRMANSGPKNAKRYIKNARKQVGKSASATSILRSAFTMPKDTGGYGKPKRWKRITTWQHFKGRAPEHRL